MTSCSPPNAQLKRVVPIKTRKKRPNIFNRIISNLGCPVTYDQKSWYYLRNSKGSTDIVSFPFSDYDITQSKEYCDADIIHLHWYAKFLDYKTFFRNCDKPIVLTLRDLFPILGIFHYENGLENNSDDLKVLNHYFLKYKISNINKYKKEIVVVGISDWITQKSKNSIINRRFTHYTIPNCLNVKSLKLIERDDARKVLSLSNESLVFSFADDDSLDNRKGIDLLIGAIEALEQKENIVILAAGKVSSNKFPLSVIVRHLGRCNNEEMNLIYSASDAFIFPTREEALGNVMLEAMACGTPVIGTPVGGLLDVIKPGFNGLLSKDLSVEGLRDTILEFVRIRNSFDREAIRNYIADNFSEELISRKYMDIYSSLLKQ